MNFVSGIFHTATEYRKKGSDSKEIPYFFSVFHENIEEERVSEFLRFLFAQKGGEKKRETRGGALNLIL